MAGNVMQISLKLLVDTKSNKVLIAEADKEFVDFIFHMMSLPLGTVVKLLTQKNMVGCLGDLYKSVESLNTQYFHSDQHKDFVLNPKPSVNVLLLSLNDATTSTNKSKDHKKKQCYTPPVNFYQGVQSTKCPRCSAQMSTKMVYAGTTDSGNTTALTGSESGGYVMGVVTYMLMDNLEVKPMSTISGISIINKFNVKDVSSLVEKEVQVGLKEGLAILKASLETKAVLSYVFLGTKKF